MGDHLAQIYQKRGNTDQAVKLFAQAVNGNRPKRDTKERLAGLVKDQKKLDQLIAAGKTEVEREATFSLGKLTDKDAKADFFVLLAPGKVEQVRFISGSDDLKSFAPKLQTLNYGFSFPDATPTRIVRRGTLKCEKSECSFSLLDPEAVTSVN